MVNDREIEYNDTLCEIEQYRCNYYEDLLPKKSRIKTLMDELFNDRDAFDYMGIKLMIKALDEVGDFYKSEFDISIRRKIENIFE